MSEQVAAFFRNLQRKPNLVSGHVTAVTRDATTGAQRSATVSIGSNTITIPLDALAPELAMGDQIRLAQYGQAALADYRLAGLEAGARPGSGLYTALDNGTVIGGTAYPGGDVVFGKPIAGNVHVEYATGRLYHRMGTEVNGIEYPDGSQLFGHAAIDGGDYVADGANVYIAPAGGVKIRNGITDALTIDATNGIRQYTDGVQRSWLKQDGSGWFVAADKFSWDVDGNITLAGAISGATIDIGGADATSFHVDLAGNMWSGAAAYADGPFKVSSAGGLTAISGSLGGWVLASNALYKLDSGTPGSSPNNGIALETSGGTDSKSVIRVYDGATLNAALGNYASGKYGIYAIEGKIGGWNINGTSLYTGTEDHSGYTASAGDITIYSDGSDASIHGKNFYIDTNGNLTATSATITGTINATAGYFGDGATRVMIEAAGINVGSTGSIRGGQTAYDTGTGFWLGYSGAYKFSIGSANGRRLTWDGTNLLVNDALVVSLAPGSELTIQGWQCTCVFSAAGANTVAWSDGVLTLADTTTYIISAGNTGIMAGRNYIYFDKAISTTSLQKTATAATSVGTGKLLIATAINSTTEALWQVFSGSGGVQIGGGQIEQRSITAAEIAAGTITANEIAANTITASQIAANTITASQIAANTITAAKIAASTITADKIAAGTITADRLSITAGGANLVKNSSFELGDVDGLAKEWLFYFDVSYDSTVLSVPTTGGVDGRAFQRISWSGANTYYKGLYWYLPEGWKDGRTYIVSFWFRAPNTTIHPVLHFNGAATIDWLEQPEPSGNWQRYVARVVIPVRVTHFFTICYYPSQPVLGPMDIDHVQIEEADVVSAWKPFPSELEPGSVTADKITATTLSAIQTNTGNLTMSGVLSIGASGGIYQGSSGTFTVPGTGLKMWNDSDVGRIAGYNAGALQWGAGTDGRFYAGGTMLDKDGLTLPASGTGISPISDMLIKWYLAGIQGSITVDRDSGFLFDFPNWLSTQRYAFSHGATINESGADSDTRIEGDTDANLLFVDASADFIGIGTSTPGAKLDIQRLSSITNTPGTGAIIGHNSTGTTAKGFGVTLDFQAQLSATVGQDVARISAAYYDNVASKKSQMILSVFDANAEREGLRIRANGSATELGFYGTVPTPRPSAYTQTYSTTTRTVSNPTAATLTDSSGGTADTTLEAIGTMYSQTAIRNNFADLAAMMNKLTADQLVLYKVVTQVIDDLQAVGLLS